jgi:hypothetical protein
VKERQDAKDELRAQVWLPADTSRRLRAIATRASLSAEQVLAHHAQMHDDGTLTVTPSPHDLSPADLCSGQVWLAGAGDWLCSRVVTAVVHEFGRRPDLPRVDVHEDGRPLAAGRLPRAGEAAATFGRSPDTGSAATIDAHAITRQDRSIIVLKWTLRGAAILAITAAIATPVAAPVPEAAVATPAVAVVAPSSGPDAPGAKLASAVKVTARLDHLVA